MPVSSSRGGGGGTGTPTPTTTEGEAHPFLLVELLEQQATGSGKLSSIHTLLKNVLQESRTVVKGTEGQRRFNVRFADFCRTAVLGMAELEDALFEHNNPGRRAADAADEEVQGITETEFVKALAGYVASQTTAMGVQYLEHIALGALTRSSSSSTATSTATRAAAAAAAAATATSGGQRKRDRAAPGEGPGGNRRKEKTESTPASSSAASATTASFLAGDGTLGLIDESVTMRAALKKVDGSDGGVRRDARAAGRDHLAKGDATPLSGVTWSAFSAFDVQHGAGRRRGAPPEGTFISTGTTASNTSNGATSGGGGGSGGNSSLPKVERVFDLHKETLKLTTIPELAQRLQPWTLPQPLSGVALDRVTVEKEKRTTATATTMSSVSSSSGNNSNALTSTTSATAGAENAGGSTALEPSFALPSPQQQQPMSVYEVCLAPSPMELLRRWEAREAVLQAISNTSAAASTSNAGGGGRRRKLTGGGGGGGLGGSPPQSAPGSLIASPLRGPDGGGAADRGDADAAQWAFFPSRRGPPISTSVPTAVMTGLVHYGVSSIESTHASQ